MAGRGRGRGRGLVIVKPQVPGGGNDTEGKIFPVHQEVIRAARGRGLKIMVAPSVGARDDTGEKVFPVHQEAISLIRAARGRGLKIMVAPSVGARGDTGEKVAPVEPTLATVKKDPRAAQALNDLKLELSTMLLEKEDLTDDEVHRIEQLAVLVADCQEVCKALYNMVKVKRNAAKAVAVVCDRLSCLEIEGTQFRSTILRLVQEDYNDREQLRASNTDTFLSCICLLSHLFVTMRLANGEVMQPLMGPVYECLVQIVSSEDIDDAEAEVFNVLMLLIGRELQDIGDERMQNLMMRVRSRIIEQTTKPQVRCYLLEVLEAFARRWQLAPNDITRFYIDVNADIYAGLVVNKT